VNSTPSEPEESGRLYSGWPMFAGCGCMWILTGWAVLAASAMFLVNPHLNSGAVLAAMLFVWMAGWLFIYWGAFKGRED
jgi:hypothetical protein